MEPVREEFAEALATLEKVLLLGTDRSTDSTVRISLLNSVIVAVVSTAEESLKDLFKTYLDVLEQGIERHAHLPGPIQMSNLDGGISILRAIIKEDRPAAANIATQIALCLSGGSGYILFKEELTNNRGNFRSSQVTTIAKNMGFVEFWQQLADSPAIETLTGESSLPARANDLIRRWNEVYDERDTIVHRISQASGWAENKIREAMLLFQSVIDRVTDCLATAADALLEQYAKRTAGAESSSS
jgi:hypothetical protein